eukprot:4458485-Pyramimonas_sp.AAC.1
MARRISWSRGARRPAQRALRAPPPPRPPPRERGGGEGGGRAISGRHPNLPRRRSSMHKSTMTSRGFRAPSRRLASSLKNTVITGNICAARASS